MVYVAPRRRESFQCLLPMDRPDVFHSCLLRGCEAEVSLSVVVARAASIRATCMYIRSEEAEVGLRS